MGPEPSNSTGLSKASMSAKHASSSSVRVQAQQCVEFDSMAKRDDLTQHGTLQTVIRKRTRDTRGCMSLPASIAFFILYAFSMRLHEDITNVFLLESAVRKSIGSNLHEVQTISALWSWLRGNFTDQMFVQEDLYGAPLDRAEWSRVLMYSQLKGSVVLQQSRASPLPSGGGPAFAPLDRSAGRRLGVAPRRLSHELAHARPELHAELPEAEEGDFLYEAVLYPTMPLPDIQRDWSDLERGEWIDSATKEIQIKALLLNAELGRPRLELLMMTFSFSRGGGIFHQVALESLFLKPFPSYISVLCDAVWVLMLVFNTGWLARRALRQAGAGCTDDEHNKFSIALECMIVVVGWANVGLFWYVYITLLGDVKVKLHAVTGIAGVDTSFALEQASDLKQASEELHEAAEAMVGAVAVPFRLGISWYNLLLMARFFVAFRAQPRLGMVINTLAGSVVDMLHFAVVFFPTLIAYVISGHFLFGRRLQEFSTLTAAAGTCFRIVIENEFDWDALSEEHFYTSALWIWSFLLIVVLIMLNMVLAIILDIYNEVRASVDASDSIFLFASQLARRVWHARDWVGDSVVENLLSEMDDSTTITKADLKEMLPSMSSTQADMIFDACQKHMRFELKRNMQRTTFVKLAAGVKMAIDAINYRIERALREPPPVEGATKRMAGGVWAEATERCPRTALSASTAMCGSTSGASTAMSGSTSGEPSEASRGRSGGRLQGAAEPFPGMPPSPGGYCPPLLAPEDASNEVPDGAGRPAWLLEIDEALDLQHVWMTTLQAQMQELQWTWKQTQRNAVETVATAPQTTAESFSPMDRGLLRRGSTAILSLGSAAYAQSFTSSSFRPEVKAVTPAGVAVL